MSTRAAIWARVSTGEQDAGNQLQQLREWAARLGYGVATEYVLDGESAYKGKHRPALEKALSAAHRREFDVLLVWALDRLSREGVEATLSTMRQFRERGVRVLSLQESWTADGSPQYQELLTSLFAWMAHMESQRRSERTKAGLARAKAAGRALGRQAGSKDAAPRKRSGYVARWERERARKAAPA